MAGMFYTTDEAAAKLGKSEEQLKGLVREGKLREFRDGGVVAYKRDEVDKLAGGSAPSEPSGSSSGEIRLEPADESGISLAASGSDVLSLEEVDAGEGTKAGTKSGRSAKEDSVITSVGASVFDDDELDEVVDPLAQTHVSDIAGLGLEGVGSGSGILDLSREPDDTSLGPEYLEEIYSEDEGGSGIEMGEATRAGLEEAIPDTMAGADDVFGVATAGESATAERPAAGPAPAAAAAPSRAARETVVTSSDAMSTALTALMIVSILVLLVGGLAAASLVQGVKPGILATLYSNATYFGGGALLLGAIATAVTFFVAKR